MLASTKRQLVLGDKPRHLRFNQIFACRQADELEAAGAVAPRFAFLLALKIGDDDRQAGEDATDRIDGGSRKRRRSRLGERSESGDRQRDGQQRDGDHEATAGVIGRRLRRAFNIEQILLSRLDGRAIASAGDHVRRFRLKARARSTSSVAYALPWTPRLNTASSHACSLSRRNRLQAIHMSGLNQ